MEQSLEGLMGLGALLAASMSPEVPLSSRFTGRKGICSPTEPKTS